MTVQGYLARPPRWIRRESLPEERLRRGNASIGSQQKVHGLALLVHRTVEMMPFTPNTEVGLVNPPGGTDAAPKDGSTVSRTPERTE